MYQYCIVRGNVVDGLVFIGPFVNNERAVEHGKILDGDWVIATLYTPQSEVAQ